jgi:Fe2+ transport system protein FeoA
VHSRQAARLRWLAFVIVFIMPTLDQLQFGQRARVANVAGHDSLVQRLLEMGLLEGEEIEVLGFAPMGDPMEIRLRDYRLSLRRLEAAGVTVHIIDDPS